MPIKKTLLLAFLLPALHLSLPAQVKFSTIADRSEIEKNDFLQVQFVVENAKSVEQLTPPAFTGFAIVSGPVQQNGMSIVNGAVSRYEGVTFLLKPKTTGKLTIPGATALVNGKSMRSNTVVITVSNNSSGNSSQQGTTPFSVPLLEEKPDVSEEYLLRPGESAVEKINKNLFVKLDVSKTACFMGEPVVASYKLCTRLRSESRVTRRPSLTGFSVYDMVQPEADNPSVEKINGKPFNVHIIRKVQLYPLQEGVFELDPVELDNTVHFIRTQQPGARNPSMQQLLDDYMNGITGGRQEDQRITLSTKPVFITVKPLPAAGKPESFDGAVGKFSLSATIDKTSFTANDIAVLQVSITGEGNMPLITAPKVQWGAGTESYETTAKENTDNRVAPIRGVKQFYYNFSVRKSGRTVIPPVVFSYFEPSSGKYKTLRTDSIVLQVANAKSSPTSPAVPVKGAIAITKKFDWKLLFWGLPVLVLALALPGIFGTKKRKNTVPAEPVKTAVKEATDPFTEARNALDNGNGQLFYRETGKVIWKTLAAKLAITASHLNKPEVVSLLRQKGAGDTLIKNLESVLLDCEMALYAPVHVHSNMKRTLDNAADFVRGLDAV